MKGYLKCRVCKRIITEIDEVDFCSLKEQNILPLLCNECYTIKGEGMTDDERSSYLIHYKNELIRQSRLNDTNKTTKPYLCQICKANEHCQNNFDYECIEASDFLFTPNNIFTVKDAFLDSLIDKDHVGLRDRELESRLNNSLLGIKTRKGRFMVILYIIFIGTILSLIGYIIMGIIN